jgi:hypothetical protein
METQKTQKNANKYECNLCDFISSNKTDYNRHVMRAKHQKKVQGNILEAKKTEMETKKLNFCGCGNSYSSRAGLWKHKTKCMNGETNEIINITETPNSSLSNKKPMSMDIETLTVLFIDTVKQNQEMQKQNQDFQQKMFEMMKDNMGGSYNNINSNNNSNNNFNLNFFLNETCKDAMNIKDFIESLQVHFKDLEYNGENGYAAGISNIFLRELNQLDICKRPIHCSDVKREVFHIKNEDSWEKERELLIRCIKQITKKNVILLADWREAHPGCMDLHNKINDKYNKINCETMGPYLDNEELKCFNKIISSVAKATVIDKKKICNS